MISLSLSLPLSSSLTCLHFFRCRRLIERLQEVERTGREDAWQQQKRVAEQEARLEAERQQHAARLAVADSASVQERDLRAAIERITRQLEENVAELTRAQVAQRAAEADAKRASDQLSQVSLRSTGGDSVLQEMIDDLRKTVNCTIHTNLPKDTVCPPLSISLSLSLSLSLSSTLRSITSFIHSH